MIKMVYSELLGQDVSEYVCYGCHSTRLKALIDKYLFECEDCQTEYNPEQCLHGSIALERKWRNLERMLNHELSQETSKAKEKESRVI